MRPTIDEMLAAVRWTIEQALVPELSSPYARFQAMIAVDLLDLIGRHWATTGEDATRTIEELREALADSLDVLPPAALSNDLVDRVRAALAEPALPPPPSAASVTARAESLAALADEVLAALATRNEVADVTARHIVRRAVVASLDRTLTREAGIDIRR